MITGISHYTGTLYNRRPAKQSAANNRADTLILRSLAGASKSAAAIATATGLSNDVVRTTLASLQAGGLIRIDDNRYRLTNSGTDRAAPGIRA